MATTISIKFSQRKWIPIHQTFAKRLWWPGKWQNRSYWLFLTPGATSTSYVQHVAAWSAEFLYQGTMLHALQLQTHPIRGPTVCHDRGFETMSSANPTLETQDWTSIPMFKSKCCMIDSKYLQIAFKHIWLSISTYLHIYDIQCLYCKSMQKQQSQTHCNVI